MSKPIAVLISDVHYSVPTLKLADAAMRQAIDKANELDIDLIVAGDLHDTKANLRGECVNAMLETFSRIKPHLDCYILVGNHDKINEKSEDHSLNFLRDRSIIIDGYEVYPVSDKDLYMIPYQHDINFLKDLLKTIPKGSTLIMHQGIQGSYAGEYIQDKSALAYKDVAGLRVISGHYHQRQTIKLPDGGKWDYIGNPYTLNFGETNDPEKGFQILYDNGNLEFVPTHLRKHIKYEVHANHWKVCLNGTQRDLVWLKILGTKEELSKLNKAEILEYYPHLGSIRIDFVLYDNAIQTNSVTQNVTQAELLDTLIDSMGKVTAECKSRLKETWKNLCE